MAARLDVEIFAVAVGVEGSSGVGSIGHHIEIITETDALYLPVVASILFTCSALFICKLYSVIGSN